MRSRPVTIDLPGEIYERLQQRANQVQRPLEAELLDVILSALRHRTVRCRTRWPRL